MVIDRITVARATHLTDELRDHLTISLPDRSGIGDHAQTRLLQIFEQNITVTRKIKLRRVEKVKYDHVVSFEAKQPQSLKNLFRVIEEIGD